MKTKKIISREKRNDNTLEKPFSIAMWYRKVTKVFKLEIPPQMFSWHHIQLKNSSSIDKLRGAQLKTERINREIFQLTYGLFEILSFIRELSEFERVSKFYSKIEHLYIWLLFLRIFDCRDVLKITTMLFEFLNNFQISKFMVFRNLRKYTDLLGYL